MTGNADEHRSAGPTMTVKLKILHGKLQNARGESAGAEVTVRSSPFVIGSDADCSICCRSSTISPHHCELRREERELLVRDLYSQTGTFVNGERIDHECVLQTGDHLQVGRLEFEVLVELAAARPSSPARGTTKTDAVAEYISDLLVEADEEDRAKRREDPETRQFRPPPDPAAAKPGAAEAKEVVEPPKKKAPPPKRPPAKLPPPPPISAGSTVEAAEETLKKIFKEKK
jgi:pSer/pThr/pTyr-binding forkhead associated (FHA) protein